MQVMAISIIFCLLNPWRAGYSSWRDFGWARPVSAMGRAEKGAALAIKGRLLMAEKRWSEAADTYKEIMGMGRYVIDPRYKELFQDDGEKNDDNSVAALPYHVVATVYQNYQP